MTLIIQTCSEYMVLIAPALDGVVLVNLLDRVTSSSME